MSLKPIDVRRKEFGRGFWGYGANRVDDFLDLVADEYEEVYTENIRIREELSSVRERLTQYEELEGSIRAALVHAEKAADDLRRSAAQEAENLRMSASREAELTIREAKTRSHQMLADSSSRVERVRESYEALTEARKNFAADFRRLLKSYLEVMDNADVLSAKEIESSLRERLDLESVAVAREAAENEPSSGEDPEATQRIDWWREEQRESPEAEEPEIEPSSAGYEASHETAISDPGAAEEVDREEPAPEDSRSGADSDDNESFPRRG